ncbi:hypothetical protein ACFQX7_21690 [Luedemannella flava]
MADLPEQSTPAGPSETPSTGTPPARPKGRKAVRTVLPIVAFAIVGVAAALLTTGIFVYQKATEPDRSTPTVSVQQLLTAIFVEEDNTRAGLFVCSEWSGDKAATAIKQQIDSRPVSRGRASRPPTPKATGQRSSCGCSTGIRRTSRQAVGDTGHSIWSRMAAGASAAPT